MNEVKLPESWRDVAIVVTDVTRRDAQTLLSAEELETAAAFAQAKRREEWVGVRVAVKRLAAERGYCVDPSPCRIESDRAGRPWLWLESGERLFASLSHSSVRVHRGSAPTPWSAAAVGRSAVGIDVQVSRDFPEKSAHLFLGEAEETAMRAQSLTNRVLHWWCAKEASWKQRSDEFTTLRQVPLQVEAVTDVSIRFTYADGAPGVVETMFAEGLVMALARRP